MENLKSLKTSGFTLVEVIVVLVTLAVLASLLIPALTGYIDNANEKKLVAECRAAVEAAQTLYSEGYAENKDITTGDVTTEDIKALSEVDGEISGIEISASCLLLHLTYTAEKVVTYCRDIEHCDEHSQTFTFSEKDARDPNSTVVKVFDTWVGETDYYLNDEIVIDGIHFVCISAHKSGSTSATRSPMDGNKSKWRVSGFDEGADKNYSSVYRYNEGVVVVYSGKEYRRTGYLLNGGAIPTGNPNYWTPVE